MKLDKWTNISIHTFIEAPQKISKITRDSLKTSRIEIRLFSIAQRYDPVSKYYMKSCTHVLSPILYCGSKLHFVENMDKESVIASGIETF
jgi:hypothetical protein